MIMICLTFAGHLDITKMFNDFHKDDLHNGDIHKDVSWSKWAFIVSMREQISPEIKVSRIATGFQQDNSIAKQDFKNGK